MNARRRSAARRCVPAGLVRRHRRRRRGCSARVRDGLGGVLLFAQNVVDDAQVAALCAQLRDARADVVIAIDEEGGDVTRLDAARRQRHAVPCRVRRSSTTSSSTTDAFTDLGHRLRSVGIDLTLAPCADINSNPRNPIIGVRSFGTTADVVARHVAAAIDGFHRGGVSVCAKHFPGPRRHQRRHAPRPARGSAPR